MPCNGGFVGCPADSFSWNFGDGSGGSGPQPTHAYASAGTYTVTLSVPGGSTSHDVYVVKAFY
jgi:PKD repeat protein